MSRRGDPAPGVFQPLRSARPSPEAQEHLAPGGLIVPDRSVAVGAVVGSSVVVTLFDPATGQGGLCHYLRPRPEPGAPATARHGLAATQALLRVFLQRSVPSDRLIAGVYGGAAPDWASPAQRSVSGANVAVAEEVLSARGVAVGDRDVGGDRGRKLLYLTGTNEVAVLRTPLIRRSDWYPEVLQAGGPQ